MKEFIKRTAYVLIRVVKYIVIGWIVAVLSCLIAKDSANYNFSFVIGMVVSLATDFLEFKYEKK